MATERDSRAHLRFVLGLFSLVALGIWGATAPWDLPTLGWKPVRGTVVAATMSVKTVTRSKGPDIHTVTARVTLRYAFGGKERIGDLLVPLPSRRWKEGDARSEDFVPEYPPGMEVEAFADPEDPLRLSARRGPHPMTWLALLAAGGCGFGWWRLRRRPA